MKPKIIVLLVLLAACKQKPAEKHDAAPAPVGDAAVVMAAPDAAPDARVVDAGAVAPDAPPGALDARVDGVGPINAKTRIKLKALKKAFPGYEVKKVSIKMGEGDLREDYVGISKGGKLLLKLVGDDNLLNVDIMSNDVWNPWGVTIGASYADVAKTLGKLDCIDAGDATDWRTAVAECDAAKVDNYVFDFTYEADSAKELIADPARLAKAKLVAIRWVVPGNGPPGTQ